MKRFARSIKHAGKGIVFALKNERNFQIEAVATGVVGVLMVWLPLSITEHIFLILAVTSVLCIELVNTALERVMDILKPRVHPYARVVKDIMAGAVLVVSCGALLTGIIIFSPHFF